MVPPSRWPTGRKLPQTGSRPLPLSEGDLELNVFSFSLNPKTERRGNQCDIALSFLLRVAKMILNKVALYFWCILCLKKLLKF